MLEEPVTGRDAYVLAQALIFSIEILEKLPEDRRPVTVDDMKAILASVPRAIADAADMDINGLLVQVAWEAPDVFEEAADRLAALVGYAEMSGGDVAALREQADGVLQSLLRQAQHDYQRNVAQTAVDAVIAYLTEGQFSERWRRNGVDMALIGLRGVGTIKGKR